MMASTQITNTEIFAFIAVLQSWSKYSRHPTGKVQFLVFKNFFLVLTKF